MAAQMLGKGGDAFVGPVEMIARHDVVSHAVSFGQFAPSLTFLLGLRRPEESGLFRPEEREMARHDAHEHILPVFPQFIGRRYELGQHQTEDVRFSAVRSYPFPKPWGDGF